MLQKTSRHPVKASENSVGQGGFCRYGVQTLFVRARLTRRRDDSLIGQVVVANVVLVTLTLVAGSLVAGLDLSSEDGRWQLLVLSWSWL